MVKLKLIIISTSFFLLQSCCGYVFTEQFNNNASSILRFYYEDHFSPPESVDDIIYYFENLTYKDTLPHPYEREYQMLKKYTNKFILFSDTDYTFLFYQGCKGSVLAGLGYHSTICETTSHHLKMNIYFYDGRHIYIKNDPLRNELVSRLFTIYARDDNYNKEMLWENITFIQHDGSETLRNVCTGEDYPSELVPPQALKLIQETLTEQNFSKIIFWNVHPNFKN